ncbi:MAG: YHYH domain-containing protein [Acidobacteriota bacterium]
MKRYLTPLCLSVLLAILAGDSSAHSGGTDAHGCHTCRTNCAAYGLKTGEYHCHGSRKRSAPSTRTYRKPPPPSPPPPSPPPPPIRIWQRDEVPESAPAPQNSIIRLGKRPGARSTRLDRQAVEVLAVVDGDTFVARAGEQLLLMTVRGVEAPELEQADGFRARAALESKIVGQRLWVDAEASSDCLIAVRALVGGQDLGGWLLAEGLVWANAEASDAMRQLQATARQLALGLWSASEPEPPWAFRAQRTMGRNSRYP